MRRLLFIAPSLPSPTFGGGAIRMYHLVRFLAQRFDLDLIAPQTPGAEGSEAQLRAWCREVEIVPQTVRPAWRKRSHLGPYEKDPALAEAILHRLRDRKYGAMQIEKPAMVPYLPTDLSIPLVLDVWAYGLSGAIRALTQERGPLVRARNAFRLARFGLFDAFCWPSTACVLVVSEQDRLRCLRTRPGRQVLVVPNGVDSSAVTPPPSGEAPQGVILFTGDLGFAPNIEAAELLALHLLPMVLASHPDAELRLVGRHPHPRVQRLAGPRVRVIANVPDMRPYLREATVFAAPHFTGAGTRTKILEAMAAGLPVVTTSIGLQGIEAEAGREVILADDLPALGEALCGLLTDPWMRADLGRSARNLIEARYDWDRCLAPLEGLYRTWLKEQAIAC
ncbi:Glycosyltransferase [Nitrospira tepida]|uniref:Glycosyltransferase n=1 Tax=Nitrospira tepida TaxID=2973512 RepID=A0AA86N023_9BACT|nr:glycosyltransferase [Nitrospira tepida]CAI4032258.1 Glycosyltransferase [Nitrospira tepida]